LGKVSASAGATLPNIAALPFHELERVLAAVEAAGLPAWLKDAKTAVVDGLKRGEKSRHFKVVAGNNRKTWADESKTCMALQPYQIQTHDQVMRSPAKMEEALRKQGYPKKDRDALWAQLVAVKSSSSVVSINDSRPAIDKPMLMTPTTPKQ